MNKNLCKMILVISFIAAIWIIKGGIDYSDPVFLIFLIPAASFGGRAVSYMGVFEWLRAPFTVVVPHSSGVGETVEPKDSNNIIVCVLGELIACPLCAGTWVAAALSVVYAVDSDFGRALVFIIGCAGVASILTRLAELIEWRGRLAWEDTATANRRNKLERM